MVDLQKCLLDSRLMIPVIHVKRSGVFIAKTGFIRELWYRPSGSVDRVRIYDFFLKASDFIFAVTNF